MDPYRIGQVLIVAPELGFGELSAAIERLGFTREAGAGAALPPLLAGEPELAGWSWHGGKPLISYTFNPVVGLRVVEVATLPPAMRAAVAGALRVVQPADVAPLLSAADARVRLRGLFTARETERFDLLPLVQRMAADRERVVATAAQDTAEALQRALDARLHTLTQLRTLCDAVAQLVPRLVDPAVTHALRPTEADCEKLFDPVLSPALAAQVALAFARMPTANPGDGYTALEVVAAPAGMLRSPNELSERFPLGYREIAGFMAPERTWVTWRHRTEKGPGVQYDGLAFVDDHWVWMPKPFRLLGPLLEARLAAAARDRVLH